MSGQDTSGQPLRWHVDAAGGRGQQFGDHNTQHNTTYNYFLGSAEVRWPHRVGVVPPEADCFQRRDLAGRVEQLLAGGHGVVLTQVLSGLGGVGKTQLAARLARQVWQQQDVDLLVWVSAGSRDAVVATYAQAAADVAPGWVGDAEQAADRWLAWLAATHRRWLVVLDDVADPADLRGLWPPAGAAGRVVVTTRRRDAALTGAGRRIVDVGVFTASEARGYLSGKLGPARSTEADLLAADVGFLPLALAQAAAYILDRDLDCAAYRRRLADRRHRLVDLAPEAQAVPDDYHATFAATWSLSIEQADQLTPAGLARPMLALASVLDPNGIPASVLTDSAAVDYLRQHRTPDLGGTQPVDAEQAADALACLHRLNLITRDSGTTSRSVRVHALVQRATRETMIPSQLDTTIGAAADALVGAWPDVERDTALGQALRTNTNTLTSQASDRLWTPDGHAVLFRTGLSLGEAGQVAAAVDYWQRLHATAVHHLGPDHPDTLATRHSLALWRGESGDPAGAATAFEQLLADYLRVLGPDHPDTLNTRHSLARWQGESGDPAGAATAFEQLLADYLRLLGPDHPHTLITRNNLAYWRGRQQDQS